MRERNHDPTTVVVEWAPWPTVCSQFLSAENSSLITERQAGESKTSEVRSTCSKITSSDTPPPFYCLCQPFVTFISLILMGNYFIYGCFLNQNVSSRTEGGRASSFTVASPGYRMASATSEVFNISLKRINKLNCKYQESTIVKVNILIFMKR